MRLRREIRLIPLALTATFLAITALVFPNPAFARKGASAATQTGWGLHQTTFSTPTGDITVRLPDDMAAGDTISGTVIVEPVGNNPRELRKNSDELGGYVVEVGKTKTPVIGKVLKWTVPITLTGGAATVALFDKKGNELAKTVVPVNPTPPGVHYPSVPTEEDFGLPSIGQAGRPISVTGPFDGDFDTTALKIGDTDAGKIAESPRKFVAESPRDVVGPTEISLEEGGVVATGTMNNLRVNLSAPKMTLHKGESTTLGVKVSGLQGIKSPVLLNLVNENPDVITMEGGDVQTIAINPDDVTEEGVFYSEHTLQGLRTGSFNISSLVSAASAAHSYETTKKWKSKGHLHRESKGWPRGHRLSRSIKEKEPEIHNRAKTQKWSDDSHSISRTNKWESEKHDINTTKSWDRGRHDYEESKKWGHHDHSSIITRSWSRDNHKIKDTRTWRGEGHQYEESKKWRDRKPNEHRYASTKKWKGYGHDSEESWKWKQDSHAESRSIRRDYGHHDRQSRMWRDDKHSENATRGWRGNEHDYTNSMQWKKERHRLGDSKKWKGEGHQYRESKMWEE